jgi:hypothetical protein
LRRFDQASQPSALHGVEPASSKRVEKRRASGALLLFDAREQRGHREDRRRLVVCFAAGEKVGVFRMQTGDCGFEPLGVRRPPRRELGCGFEGVSAGVRVGGWREGVGGLKELPALAVVSAV